MPMVLSDAWTASPKSAAARSGSASTTVLSSSPTAVADWCRFNGTGTAFIDPGSPWQNAQIESFNGRMRDEHLNAQRFDTLLEAQVLTEDWRIDYNMIRPQERTRLAQPSPVRRGLAPPTSTPTRIAGGPTNGIPPLSPWRPSDGRLALRMEGHRGWLWGAKAPQAVERQLRDA